MGETLYFWMSNTNYKKNANERRFLFLVAYILMYLYVLWRRQYSRYDVVKRFFLC